MGLITYDNIEDNVTDVSANELNQRYGNIIAQVNGNLDSANFKAGGIPASALSSEIYSNMWPVGSIYINATDNTNPGTLLGFGTWEAFGTGRVPVGYDASQTEFNAAQKTGGHKELQSHTHGVTDPGHSHPMPAYYNTGGTINRVALAVGSSIGNSPTPTGSSGTGISIQSSGNGDGGNLQPYITVYMWKRTS